MTCVNDGIRALEAIAAGDYDPLPTEIRMPEVDGVELSLKVSKDRPHLPILLMTGFATEQKRAHNLSALIHGVLQEAFTLVQLRKAVSQALAARPAR